MCIALEAIKKSVFGQGCVGLLRFLEGFLAHRTAGFLRSPWWRLASNVGQINHLGRAFSFSSARHRRNSGSCTRLTVCLRLGPAPDDPVHFWCKANRHPPPPSGLHSTPCGARTMRPVTGPSGVSAWRAAGAGTGPRCAPAPARPGTAQSAQRPRPVPGGPAVPGP